MFEQLQTKFTILYKITILIYFSIQKNLSIIVVWIRNRLLNREKMTFAISNKTLQII